MWVVMRIEHDFSGTDRLSNQQIDQRVDKTKLGLNWQAWNNRYMKWNEKKSNKKTAPKQPICYRFSSFIFLRGKKAKFRKLMMIIRKRSYTDKQTDRPKTVVSCTFSILHFFLVSSKRQTVARYLLQYSRMKKQTDRHEKRMKNELPLNPLNQMNI